MRDRPNSSSNLLKKLFSSHKKHHVQDKKEDRSCIQELPVTNAKEVLTQFPLHPKDSFWNRFLSTLSCKAECEETNHHHIPGKSKPS